MSTADRTAVADAVASALLGLDIMELNARSGYRPGHGYVHESEAAQEILDEVLEPYLRNLEHTGQPQKIDHVVRAGHP